MAATDAKHGTTADGDDEPTDLHIPYKVPLDGETQAAMIGALVKYLLYQRGQIPWRLVHGAAKKARALVFSTDSLAQSSLPLIFSHRVRQVALLFGASIANPREVWLLKFQQHDSKAGSEVLTLSDRERRRRLCVQKIIRTVLGYATQHFVSAVAPTSIHLLFKAEVHEDDILQGFVPRPSWKLRVLKSKTHKRLHA
ncbi:hypothetical protein P43SY_002418 [Pythium insidiosum]|uniref:Uncharacterized protein n=1 Tax=Pythium insidiosum TaxID=114742 RepID=A0AAD5Q8Z8_PYTIN|nr:hypothetical protein P43SY_002418 [Pythium insidiosum]